MESLLMSLLVYQDVILATTAFIAAPLLLTGVFNLIGQLFED